MENKTSLKSFNGFLTNLEKQSKQELHGPAYYVVLMCSHNDLDLG